MAVNSCAAIIEQLFRRNGGWKRLQGELSVYYWPRIAGSEIGDKTEPTHFRNGYLYIKTDNPALAHQLSFFSAEIVKRYHQQLGLENLKGIKIRIGAITGKATVPQASDPAGELSASERNWITSCAEQISDPQLAKRFKETMSRFYLQHHRILADGGKHCLACQAVIDARYSYCPCCERKIIQETEAYFEYFKKKKDASHGEELALPDDFLNHPALKDFMRPKTSGGN